MAVIVTITQIATALGISRTAANKRAKKWVPINETGVAKFDVDTLPLDPAEKKRIAAYLQDKAIGKAIAEFRESCATLPVPSVETLPAVPEAAADLPALTLLKTWQRETMDARLYFMRLLEQAKGTGRGGLARMLVNMEKRSREGSLPLEAQALVRVANKRHGADGGKRALSQSTLKKWWMAWLDSGKNPAALAPKDTERKELPAWAAPFLACWQKPQKPSVAAALDNLKTVLPPDIPMPSYHQARRILMRVGNVEMQRGRMTGQELRSIRPYVKRDTTDMVPGECYISDGLTFKSWGIAHPAHGRPFSPEICDVQDVHTRKIVGWSAGLAESGPTMAAGLRHAVETNGVPSLFYHDKGPGYENQLLQDPVTGIVTRLGIHNLTSTARQSQARGMIEKLRRDLWHREAKNFLTYKGREMDRETKLKVHKIIKKDLKTKGISDFVMPWPEFLVWVQERVDAYNNRPHQALPRIRDPHTGHLRHMTPNEMWDKAVAEHGAPPKLPPEEIADLFLPEKICKVVRGTVQLFGNPYFNGSLEEFHGDQVRVGYDVHDPRGVLVRDLEGRLICIAGFKGNHRRYIAKPISEMAAEKREADRLKRLAVKEEEIRLERIGTVEIHKAPEHIELTSELIEAEAKREEKEKRKEENRRRFFNDVNEIYDDIRAREKLGLAKPYEIAWANDKDRSEQLGKRVGLYKEDPCCAGRFKEE